MKNHLLSIFPVHGGEVYARLSCVALTEVDPACAGPFVCESPDALRACLKTSFSSSETDDIIHLIEAGEVVHRQIDDADARKLGFQPAIQ